MTGTWFSRMVAGELLVLAVLLGAWGVRSISSGAAPEPADVSVPEDAPMERPAAVGLTEQMPEPVDERASLAEMTQPRIRIDKSVGVLEVFDGDRLVRRYPASVGGREGDKVRSGDRRTPEGEFFVCVKNPASRFVLSLGLSYPTIEDARRGLRDKLISQAEYRHIVNEITHGRRPPWNTALGGEIMIHGRRDGGRDTLGCIALEDDAIRQLYPHIPIGTRVVIHP